MRINIYSEEITGEIASTTKTADTGETFYGVRVMLLSPNQLHHTETDNDRSAVTFWFSDQELADDLGGALAEALAQ